MLSNTLTPEQRRKNVRTAWMLAAFVLFILVTSIPFWKGLHELVVASGL